MYPKRQSGKQEPSSKDRSENVNSDTAEMNTEWKSDGFVVPPKAANNDKVEESAESPEERNPVKRNADEVTSPRTPSRTKVESRGLIGVREAACKDSTLKFNALLHHIDRTELKRAFEGLNKAAKVGIDGVTWQDYERNVEANLADLHGRIHRGGYRAKPTLRGWIPKPDGRKRPLGVTSMEDKIVQQAVATVLKSIYEEDFLDFSYGFREGKNQHDALDRLYVEISDQKVNWILDADIEGFFDAMSHEWIMEFLKHRVSDPRILRLIQKWLKAGVVEEGKRTKTTVGAPQGSVIAPLLSNVYLHYVFDLWIENWRKKHCRGNSIVVRYADDFVIGFENRDDAQKCMEELRERFAKFGLKLHEGKTRLIEFGRFAANNRKWRGDGRPETFDFLGFTHKCAKTLKDGYFTIHRSSISKRVRATLAAIKLKLKKRRHRPLDETGRWLGRVIGGWLNYHAVPSNTWPWRFIKAVTRLWLRSIRRRSQKGRSRWTWDRMTLLQRRYFPVARVLHPYPNQRYSA